MTFSTPLRRTAALLAVTLLLTLPASAHAQSTPPSVALVATNSLAISRADETVGLPWASVMSALPSARPNNVRVLDAGTGIERVSQVVDNDGDGTPDELIFQADFAAGEARGFTLQSAPAKATFAKGRVYVTHTEPRDDMAWESDRIGFRMYGQGLYKVDSLDSSGIDIWNKRTRDLIVDKWYKKGHDAYHVDSGEGADFYDVGHSLGTGGTALWMNGALDYAHNFKNHRIIADGPIRVIFEVEYEPWGPKGSRVTETKRISLDAGRNLNKSTSIFRAVDGATDITYATGTVKRAGMIGLESRANRWAWLTGWGAVLLKGGGHGELGSAVLLPRDEVTDWKETTDHYLAIAHAKPGVPVTHYFGGGWTASLDFRDVEDWWKYLNQMALRYETPVKVTLGATR
jgi:pectinesterase